MVLIQDQESGQSLVNYSENDDQNRVDDGRNVSPIRGCFLRFVLLNFSCSYSPVKILHRNLGTHDECHESERYRNANQHLPLVSILGSNFPLVLSVRVNGDLALEVWSFRGNISETSDEPFISNVVLLALPTLSEEG